MAKKKKHCKKPSDNPYFYNPDFKGPGKKRGKRGRKRVLDRINYKDFHKARNGESYYSRNLILKELGFPTYKNYLQSKLWKQIRKRVLKRESNTCQICEQYGNHVHHSRYHKNDLLGRNLKFLHCVCEDCHEKIEFNNGEKVWLEEAVKRQKTLTSSIHYEKEIKEEYDKKYSYLDKEYDQMFKNF